MGYPGLHRMTGMGSNRLPEGRKRNVSPEKLTNARSNEDWPRRELNDRRSITESEGHLRLVLTLSLIPLDGVSTCGLNRTSMRPQMGWGPVECQPHGPSTTSHAHGLLKGPC